MTEQGQSKGAEGIARMTLLILSIAVALLSVVAALDDSALVMITDPATTNAMPRKKVLVTGAAGFVGSHVADYLLSRGDYVVIVDEVNDYYDVTIKEGNLRMLQEKYDATRLAIYRGDIVDDVFMQQVFAEHSFDAVCHIAARAGVRPSIQNPFLYVHSNIVATVKLMELAVKHKVQNFVFASSSSVYGGSKSVYFSERERVDNPISPYAATKKSCELFSYAYHHAYDLNVTALRFFTVYGPRGRPDMAPFMFVDRVSRGLHIQQFGDGTSSRDYTYIDDIVQGVVRSIDKPTPYKILNLGKGSGTVLNDFMGMVEKYVGKAAIIDILPDQPGDVPYTCANVSLAHGHLGYQATVPFEEGIQRTVQWYKQAYPDAAAASSTTAKNLRRRLMERVLQEEPHHFERLLQRVLMEDSTAFEDELGGDVEFLEALLKASTETKNQRKRKLQSTEERSWETMSIVAPHTEHKKVLVTGGAGFIGSHVADFLLSRGDSVVVVNKEGEDGKANLNYLQEKYGKTGKLAIFLGDICDAEFMGKIFTEENPEWICHLAARSNLAGSFTDPVDYIHSNIEGTVRLLELSKGSDFGGHTIQNFVLASSNTVYGSQSSRGEIDTQAHVRAEHDRVDYPKTPYAATKKSAELLAYTYHHLYRFPVAALRLFDVYGPRYRADTEPFQLVDRTLSAGDISEFTADTSSRDYTYIEDVVKGIVSALDRPYGYEIYNLGSGSESCRTGAGVQEFAKLAAQSAGKLVDVEDQVAADMVTSTKRVDGVSCADVRKAEHLLGYKANVSLQDGIQRTVAWHQQTYYPDSPLTQPVGGGVEEATELGTDEPHATGEVAVEDPHAMEKVVPPVDKQHETPQELLRSNAALGGAAKFKSAGEEKSYSNFPAWLRSLAFLQWLLVVAILVARAYFKTPLGPFGRPHADELTSN